MFLRATLRSLGRMRGFTTGVVGTIALGIGASGAMFSIVYAVLLRPLPYPDADRLVMVWETLKLDPALRVNPEIAARLAQRSMVFSRVLPTWRRANHVFEEIGGYAPRQFTLTGTADPERVDGIVATSSFFRVLGVQPIVGRSFTPAEDEPGQDEVVLLSDALWQRRFGRDPQAIGRAIGIDGIPHTIVGILPRDTTLVLPNAPRSPSLVVPVPHAFSQEQKWALLYAVARLRRHVTIDAARADMAAVAKQLAESEPRYRTRGTNVFALAGEVSRDSRNVLLILLAATACILLIAAVNVANLLMLRAAARGRELAIRTALGAGRARLMKEAMIESLVLTGAGSVGGLLVARWTTGLLVALMPKQLFPRMEDVAVDLPVMAFGFGVALAVGLAAGLAPAWYAHGSVRRVRLGEMLRGSVGSVTGSPKRGLIRRSLVTLEVAIAMVVLVAAALLTETYVRLTRVDLGVQAERVLTFDLVLPAATYKTPESRVAFADTLMQRLQVLGGVEAAGVTSSLPVQSSFTASMSGIVVEGRPPSEAGAILQLRMVTPGVFSATGIRLSKGRLLGDEDARAEAIVVNRAMVRRYWPSASDPASESIGRRVKIGDRWTRIVGVVDDVKYDGPQGQVEPEAYVSYPFWPVEHVSIVMRTAGDPIALVPGAREAVKSVDRDLPLQEVRSLEAVFAETVASPRFRSALLGSFALLALGLALIGLYGVISQSVSQRGREIGIRLALGAAHARIVRMVVSETLLLVAVGITLGAAGSLAVNRVLAGLLFGTTATNPGVYVGVALTIAATALAASVAPARRAANTDPIAVLRGD